MHIYQNDMTDSMGRKYLLIVFNHFKNNEIHRGEIYYGDEPMSEEELTEKKLKIVDEFLNTFRAGFYKFTKKDVLKAYAKVDESIKKVYKSLYPQGGYRNGGRPKGSKTEKTERINWAVTPEEKEYLTRSLERFRYYKDPEYKEKMRKLSEKAAAPYIEGFEKAIKLEKVKSELAPYLRKIDDNFGSDEAARQKWRKKMLNTNPAMLPYILEHFKLFGIEGAADDNFRPKSPKGLNFPDELDETFSLDLNNSPLQIAEKRLKKPSNKSEKQ